MLLANCTNRPNSLHLLTGIRSNLFSFQNGINNVKRNNNSATNRLVAYLLSTKSKLFLSLFRQ
jgi:hypothetical protein